MPLFSTKVLSGTGLWGLESPTPLLKQCAMIEATISGLESTSVGFWKRLRRLLHFFRIARKSADACRLWDMIKCVMAKTS